jgi:hypothetical protein
MMWHLALHPSQALLAKPESSAGVAANAAKFMLGSNPYPLRLTANFILTQNVCFDLV